MDLIKFSTDIETVNDLQLDDTNRDIIKELSRLGIEVERQRVNSSGGKAKTLTPSWYKNRPIKNYAYNFGDSMLHLFVDKKSGVLVRVTLGDVIVDENRKGIKRTLRKLALDIDHAHRAMEIERDKTNSIKMDDLTSAELDKVLEKDERISKSSKYRGNALAIQIKDLTKGSGRFIIGNKKSDAFLSKRNSAKGKPSFTSLREQFEVFGSLDKAVEVAKSIPNAYYVFKI